MKIQTAILLASLGWAATALAAPETFDFKDPKGVNNAGFKLDAPLESINGNASGISGTVTFDPENPAATRGKIMVAANTLMLPNPMQQGHMRSDKWLDVAKYPVISFEATELKNVKTEGEVTTAEAAGTFTCKGVSKEMMIPVKLTYLKDKLSQRVPSMKGDLLVIRANFSIKRGDFNINPGQLEDKVSDEIDLTLSVAGAAAK
jgi:polyisoprenoid-binding protein YceI